MPATNSQKFISLTGMEYYTDEVKKLIRQMIADSSEFEIVTANSYLNFPIVGSQNKLYIDKTNNKTYRYDEASLKYYIIGSDYDDIDLIDSNWSNN